MQLYNIQTKQIEFKEYIKTDDAIIYTKFLNKDDLKAHGFKMVNETPPPTILPHQELRQITTETDTYNISYVVEQKEKDELMNELISTFKQRVQSLLDEKAREKGYDDIVSACSYAGYENEFQAEAVAFGKWRAKVWRWGYSLLNQDIQAESIDIDEILKDMPEF